MKRLLEIGGLENGIYKIMQSSFAHASQSSPHYISAYPDNKSFSIDIDIVTVFVLIMLYLLSLILLYILSLLVIVSLC